MPVTPFKIHIRQPCRQDFSAMPQVHGGLHCASCQKTITDFTRLSDAELIDLLSRPDPTRCGVFSQRQLGQLYYLPAPPAPHHARLAVLLAGLLTLQPSPSSATVPVQHQTLSQAPTGNDTRGGGTLVGKVSNAATRSALPCSIQLYAARQGDTVLLTVNSNAEGRYSISLAGLRLQRFFRLVFSCPGFAPRTVVVDRDHLPAFLPVHLKLDPTAQERELMYDAENRYVTGGVEPLLYNPEREYATGGPLPKMQVAPRTERPTRWQRLRAAFRRLLHRQPRE